MSGRFTIGIDLGGTQVRAALVENGAILLRASARTNVVDGPLGVLEQFWSLIDQVCNDNCRHELAGVGICAPGPLDSVTGEVIGIPTLPNWEGFQLRRAVQDKLGLPVIVENDGVAAAYGEWRFGAGKGRDNLVYVTVSTGVGGGIIVDGRLVHGRRGMAGHVGHFRMAPEGPRCSCGAIGCFEAFASGSALGRRGCAAGEQHKGSYLGQIEGTIDARHVVEGARLGDEVCKALLAEEAEYLGIGFTGLIHLFSPDLVIMGGGVSQAFGLMRDRIVDVISKTAMPPFRNVPVVVAQLADSSGLVGAAALVSAALKK